MIGNGRLLAQTANTPVRSVDEVQRGFRLALGSRVFIGSECRPLLLEFSLASGLLFAAGKHIPDFLLAACSAVIGIAAISERASSSNPRASALSLFANASSVAWIALVAPFSLSSWNETS